MAQRLNWLVSSAFIWLIKLYQKLLSGKIEMRRCIYADSCSNYAITELTESKNIFSSIISIYRRYKSCKILNIICECPGHWHIINGAGQVIQSKALSSLTINRIKKIIHENNM